MSTDQRLQSRVLRRELHSPKSGLAIVLALLAVVALAWLGTEGVLAALGRPAILLSPAAMAAGIRGLPSVQPAVLIVAGAVLAVPGVILIVLSLTAGRRGRHVIAAKGTAAVVDDQVVASALVRAVSQAAGISPDRAVASVGRRSGVVRITPISGVALDLDAVRRAANDAAAGFGLEPTIRVSTKVDKKGKVGG